MKLCMVTHVMYPDMEFASAELQIAFSVQNCPSFSKLVYITHGFLVIQPSTKNNKIVVKSDVKSLR